MARLILVADDSPTIQRRAQGILEGEGFEVETVSNGVAAIKKLPKLQPILVLADVSMPGKDGYEVCDYVKTSADFRHVPVLLVSSDLEPYDEQRGTQVGADGIIKKPFTPHDLIAMVAKFTGLGEAPASQPTLPDTLVTSSPAAVPEVPPTGSGLEPSTRSQEQDLAVLPAGSAFEGPPLDEIPATPAEPVPDISLQPSPEPALQVWAQSLPEPPLAAPPEDVLGGSSGPLLVPPEPFPGFALDLTPKPTPEPDLGTQPEPALVSPELISETAPAAVLESTLVIPEPTPEPVPEAAPEPALVSPELISETAPEAVPESTLVIPEPTPEPMPEAAPEPALVSPELISETAPEAVPESTLVIPEPTPEPMPEAAPEPALVSPELISETAPEAGSEQVSVVSEPVAESGLPLAPESAIDELAPAPLAPEPPPLLDGQHRKPTAATHLDGFSLAEVAEGQIYVAPPETEAGPPPEAEVAQPGGAPAGLPSVVDQEWVYVVVHKVVQKMAPPVLPPELVEELVRILTEEITAELNAASSQAY